MRVHNWIEDKSIAKDTSPRMTNLYVIDRFGRVYVINAIRHVLPIADGVWSCGIGFRFVYHIED